MRRFLILAEGKFSHLRSKTANGAIAFIPSEVAGVIDSTKAGQTAQSVLGYGGTIPVVRDLAEGLRLVPKPTHLLIGIAPSGGKIPDEMRPALAEALRAGLHLVNGLHSFLGDDPEFSRIAQDSGVTITDLRRIRPEYKRIPSGSWRKRAARVVLTIGSDCNVGKMTASLKIIESLRERGIKTGFVATGQTGILINGRGIGVDAAVGDYIAGGVEKEIDIVESEGNTIIIVEGQGALTHPAYSGVSLGLLHGTMPDAMILCHQPARIRNNYGYRIPDLGAVIRLHESAMEFFKPSPVVGIALNTAGLTDEEARRVERQIAEQTQLPSADVFRFGGAALADALIRRFESDKSKQS